MPCKDYCVGEKENKIVINVQWFERNGNEKIFSVQLQTLILQQFKN